jgi:hypothetical protein
MLFADTAHKEVGGFGYRSKTYLHVYSRLSQGDLHV